MDNRPKVHGSGVLGFVERDLEKGRVEEALLKLKQLAAKPEGCASDAWPGSFETGSFPGEGA